MNKWGDVREGGLASGLPPEQRKTKSMFPFMILA